MNLENRNNQVVYIVAGQKYSSLSNRVRKLLSLRDRFEKLVLFTKDDGKCNSDVIQIKPTPNPTGFLRFLGLDMLKRKIDRYLFFPSPGILYVHKMQKRIDKFIKNDIDQGKNVCLITSVPPHDVCLVGLHIKKKYPDLYWIVDWRDLWSYDENYLNRIDAKHRNKLLGLENRILNGCDINVTTNPFARDVLINKYHVPSRRVVSINHSFNQDDLLEISGTDATDIHAKSTGEIKIGFLGTLFKPPKVPGERALEAIKHVRDSGINVKLHHYGGVPDSIKNSKTWGQSECIDFHGKVDRKSGLEKLSQCDFLLLVLADLPNCKTIVHIKLPDYLLINRPIIAIVPVPSAISDLIHKTNNGYVIPANQDWGIGLEKLLNAIKDGANSPIRNEKEICRYDWQYISEQWLNLINRSNA